jgi:hypothetical protein
LSGQQRRHPNEAMREAARRGVVPQEERDRTTVAERASTAVRDAFQRQRARTAVAPSDDGAGQ